MKEFSDKSANNMLVNPWMPSVQKKSHIFKKTAAESCKYAWPLCGH